MSADDEQLSLVAEMQRAVDKEPNSARARLRLAGALKKSERLADCERELRKALELDPTLAEAWTNLGGMLFSRWDFKGSIEANAKAIEHRPELLAAHYNKGLGHLYLNESEEMLACFRRVLEIDPMNAGGHYHMAVGLNALGKAELARTALSRAEELGYSPRPELLRAIEKALKDKNQGEGPLTIELGQDPGDSGTDKP